MKKKTKRSKRQFKITVSFRSGKVGGKKVDTGVHANGKPNPKVAVNLRDLDSSLKRIPNACERTRRMFVLLSDVIGLKDRVVVRPNEFELIVGDNLDRAVVGRHALLAFQEAYGFTRTKTVTVA